MKSIKVAIAGIGNCASSLVQGIEYYRTPNASVQTGLMHMSIGGWKPSDIEIVAAFDVDNRKVGYSLEEAVFQLQTVREFFNRCCRHPECVFKWGRCSTGSRTTWRATTTAKHSDRLMMILWMCRWHCDRPEPKCSFATSRSVPSRRCVITRKLALMRVSHW